jgi:hypothetical protein
LNCNSFLLMCTYKKWKKHHIKYKCYKNMLKLYVFEYLLEHIFEKKCSFEFIKVCPSVCTLFFRHLSTYDLQILDSKRRLSIYEESGWGFWCKAQELWDWAQIKVFSLYFINFWETINVFQLISQGYSKIQIFQKKFLLGSIGSSW